MYVNIFIQDRKSRLNYSLLFLLLLAVRIVCTRNILLYFFFRGFLPP